jgi:tetratricopeptide (TPR) repeat protein
VNFGPEHVAMATLATMVLIFGVHSFVDWTWFIPGTAVMALLIAGWTVGRGPLDEPAPDARMLGARVAAGVRQPWRIAAACLALAVGLLAGYTAWQPLRARDADNAALALPPKDYNKAIALTEKAASRNPLSIDPPLTRAVVEATSQHPDRARAALIEAIRLQPSNPQPWEFLSRFTLDQENDATLALRLLGPALYLDPKSPTGAADYLKALRVLTAEAQAKAEKQARKKAERAAAKAKKKQKKG